MLYDRGFIFMKKLKEIEIDVDGVLANMDGEYENYLKDIIPDFTEEKYVTEWNMPFVKENFPKAFERVQRLYRDPEFIYNLKRFPKVEEGLINLGEVVKDKAEIIIHTHIFDIGSVYQSREKWLNDLREETGVDFQIEISTGQKKDTRKNTYIIIEDNVTNLQRSNAKYKFLIRRCHNRSYGVKDIGSCKKGFVCESFYDTVPIIKRILEGEFE